ncbi:Uncharacterized conserved protein YbjT, contains NAD(P)-binding and DUF2867 domains [Pseudoxanthomonas sp. GM95]|uniref:SDR family oxidoreductase n=1 Tax=Pseudoxanthomonas sp. GM95 TaxID=1881043 RepID=UPI0008B768AB|nr:NAD(P)H-binding protein [Pseudoxanthomonas sp. GM95]SEL11475.1 Uncharacterized conserved protein YbjT, contains NAD(P)-binding and DUF2867 domains [Pseudoxanthomonas sp. GM95]
MSLNLKVVVLGGGGLIGTRVVSALQAAGAQVIAASRRTGVNILTGEGLETALTGADVVIDTSDVPSFDPSSLASFFGDAAKHVYQAERAAGVRHHICLSIVGVDRVRGNPYFDAKLGQEDLVRASGVPYTIARATQFFEFMPTLATGFTKGLITHLPNAQFQPIAADDVAKALASIALNDPHHGAVTIAGKEHAPFESWFARLFTATRDPRRAIADVEATYFGGPLQDDSIIAAHPDYTGHLGFDDWILTESAQHALNHDRHADAVSEIKRSTTA